MDRYRALGGNKGHRRDPTHVESAKVGFPAHEETVVERKLEPAVAGGMGSLDAEAQDVAMFVHGVELFPLEDIRDDVHVAAERAALHARGIEKAFTSRGINGVIHRVVAE